MNKQSLQKADFIHENGDQMSFGSGILRSGTLHSQGFWPRINCSRMKLPNCGSPSSDSSSKIGRHFSDIVVLKLKAAKNAFYKKGLPKLIFQNETFFQKDSDDF